MADSLRVIIPVKILSLGKQRLAHYLSDVQRRELAQAMLQDMLVALSRCAGVSRVVLVSKDAQVQALAAQFGADLLAEPDECNSLNAAVQFAIEQAVQQHVASVLVLHGDIPLIQATDIDQIIQQQQTHTICLIPDAQDNGTNGLLLKLPADFTCAYGEQSFSRHLAQATEKGLSCCTIRNIAALQLDVDEAADLLALQQRLKQESHTYQLLATPGWQHTLRSVASS